MLESVHVVINRIASQSLSSSRGRELHQLRLAHKDLRTAKDSSSFRGVRHSGGDTNALTDEFKAFLRDRRKGRKDAQKQVKVSAEHLAVKAVQGTNDITLRDVNRMTKVPVSYRKPLVEVSPDRPHSEYLRRKEVKERRKERQAVREHTTVLTKSVRIERNDRRIRDKKASRGAKPVPEHLFGVKRRGASSSRLGDVAVTEKKSLPKPLPRIPEHEPPVSETIDLLQINEWLGETSVPSSEEGRASQQLNKLEQDLWGF